MKASGLHQNFFFLSAIMILSVLTGCSPRTLEAQTENQEQPAEPPEMGLHLAALMGNIDAVRQHINVGTDLNEKDAYGSIPLIIATTFGKTEVAKALIEAGADLEIKDSYGSTPLHVASLMCHTEIIEALLDKGANRFTRSNSGATAFDIVAAPFEDDIALYDQLSTGLAPMGLKLDYDMIKKTRPRIAEILRASPEDLKAVEYTPMASDDWKVSTPEDQGLDPMLVAELYLDAAAMENVYGLLVLKNGYLIAEQYYNKRKAEQRTLVQSVSKSYVSALVGIALDKGCLTSVDQKMMEFFPEFIDQISDPRKAEITIRDLLQMRAGYPWEESDTALWQTFIEGPHLPLIVDIPLIDDPGAGFNYSNTSSYLLGVIVSTACGTDLKAFAQEYLCTPIGSDVGDWYQDTFKNYYNFFGFTARDMARFGLLYHNEGKFNGNRVISPGWVRESLQSYSEDTWVSMDRLNQIGRYFKDLGYGYQWWSARVGEHQFNYAAGHGGQLIILLDELDMVIVLISDPLYLQHNDEAWKIEKGSINLVGKFIKLLPKEL